MTTATKTRSLLDQLAALQQLADEAHAKAREARDTRNRWEAEVHELRARSGQVDDAEQAELKAEIAAREQSRLHNVGPYAEAYQTAVEPYHAADQKLQQFKRSNLRGLIDEAAADAGQALEQVREAWEQIANGCVVYEAARDRARTVVVSVTGMDGQDLAYDPNIEYWHGLAAGALDAEPILPRLSDLGGWKADNHVD